MMIRACIVLGALGAFGPFAAAAPALKSNPKIGEVGFALSDTGYYQLSWKPEDEEVAAEFILEESRTSDFSQPKLIYEGPDLATAFSGRVDGEYYYRLRAGDGAWSEPLKVVVRHHSLKEAVIYLSIGAVVFFATAVLVVAGHFAHRREGQQT